MTKLLDTNNYIIAFDLDGTLVNTDKANSMAYQRSVYDVTGITVDIENCRITRDSLKTKINVSDGILHEIIIKKEQLFTELLLYTQPLPALFILQHLKNTHNVLLTYARQERAYSVLEYYGVTSLFDNFYYRDCYSGKSKFDYLVNELHYSSDKIILFENDQKAIADAIHFGIPQRNIYKS